MRFFWGRIIGSLVGAFGGLPGIAFGFLVGYLADLLLTDHQVKKEAKLFLVNSTGELRWVPPIPLLITGLAVTNPAGNTLTAPAIIAAIRPRLRRRLEPIVDVALQLGDSIDRAHLLAYAREHLSDFDRATILTAHSTLVHSDAELQRTAGDLNVDSAVVSELLAVRHRDPQACKVLGVNEDASTEEIKHTYRRLAAQFHPDTTADLSPQQQEASSAAFVMIRDAYERLTGLRNSREE